MSDARPIQPPTKPMPGIAAGHIEPAEATQAVATVLRYGWQKARDHLRHSLPWIGLSAYLAYALWLKEPPRQVPAEATVNSGNESAAMQTVMRPSLEPATLIGHWARIGTPHTRLEFLPDGAVISRTQGKAEKGTYEVKDSWITMRFGDSPLFWDVHPLPDRFLVSDDELTLIATRSTGDIASAQVYRFKRIKDSASGEVAPVSSTQ